MKAVTHLWLRQAAKRAREHLASIPYDQLGPAGRLLVQPPITPISSGPESSA